MYSKEPLKGKLLLSELALITDLSFNRSVILLTDHNEEGAIGFILNKPLDYSLNDLLPDVTAQFTVYNGGPVEQDNLYFIHTIPTLIPNSIEISENIYWGGDFETTKTLLNNGELKKSMIRFFLGYSGWEKNQLENEIRAASWIVRNNEYGNRLLKKSSYDFWKEEIKELGGDYPIWSNAPENPLLN